MDKKKDLPPSNEFLKMTARCLFSELTETRDSCPLFFSQPKNYSGKGPEQRNETGLQGTKVGAVSNGRMDFFFRLRWIVLNEPGLEKFASGYSHHYSENGHSRAPVFSY